MQSTLQITANPDDTTINEAIHIKNTLDEGYIYNIDVLEMEDESFKLFFKELSKLYKFKIFDFSVNNNFFETYKSDDFLITVSGNKNYKYISISTKTLKSSENIFKIYKKITEDLEKSDVYIFMTSFYSNRGLVQSSVKKINLSDLDVSKDYYPYIDTDILFEEFFANQENILMFCGEPGTGKSKLVSLCLKYAIQNYETLPYTDTDDLLDFVSVAYVKSQDVISEDIWWKTLEDSSFDLVIFDDLDFFLTRRSEEEMSQTDNNKNKFLNQFLSFTDGVSHNDTKFLITTNQSYNDIDPALIRKGRLFDILELRRLKNNEAKDIWLKEELKPELFNFTSDVLQADLGSLISKYKISPSKPKKYLKEDNISKISKETKKLGF